MDDKFIDTTTDPLLEPVHISMAPANPIKNVPPIPFVRNKYGLYEHIQYKYLESGRINWRAMIHPKYLTLNQTHKSYEENLTKIKNGEIKIEDLEDSKLLILLAGIKEIAFIRGYESVDYEFQCTTLNFVSVKAKIKWIPNYETDNQFILFSSTADANENNTKGFGKDVLTTIAENRAFIRAVRNFLGIHILGFDEMAETNRKETEISQTTVDNLPATDPRCVLMTKIQEANMNFDKFKEFASRKKCLEAIGWNSANDIPKSMCFSLIALLTEYINKDHNV